MRPLDKQMPPVWEAYPDGQRVPTGVANNHLLDAVGEYCSYCEMRLGGGAILHHKLQREMPESVPKEDWRHLLLICYDCRRHMTEDALTPDRLDDYLWPDAHPSFSLHADSPFRYRLKPVPYVITDEDGSREEHDEEFVFVEVNPEADAELRRKAANTIELFKLNSPYYDDSRHILEVPRSDHLQVLCNRLQQRTQAWTRAQASVSRVRQMRELPEVRENPDLEQLLHQQITHTAHGKGNWSVWMTVFWQELEEKDVLERIFLEMPEDNPGFHFAGTHFGQLRWEAL